MASKQTRSYWYNNVLNFFDDQLNPGFTSGLWRNCPSLAILCDPSVGVSFMDDGFYVHDDNSPTGKRWVESGDTPVVSTTDAANGVISLASNAATDNHACTIASNGEAWDFATGKELWFEARVKLTEANTDDANILIGLCDSPGADVLQDNGAGPPASYDGAVFFKVDGGTTWQFETSDATVQTTATSPGAFTSATWHTVGFHYDGVTTITPYIDGVAGTAHTITAAIAEMEFVASVKNGGSNKETLLIDYIKIVNVR